MKLEPTGDKYLVELIEKENKTAAGIILGQGKPAELRVCEAKVVARGPGGKDLNGVERDMDAEVGDTILIDRMVGADLPSGYVDDSQRKFKFINNGNIIAKVS